MRAISRSGVVGFVSALVLLVACGSDAVVSDAVASDDAVSEEPAADRATVVVTTNILGDVVGSLVGDEIDVITIMPVGADPHDFQASAQQAAQIADADLIIVNGGDFEEGLMDIVGSAQDDGVPVYEAIQAVETVSFEEHDDEHEDEDHDEHEDEDHDEHEDEDHDEHEDEDHDEHEHDGDDPHFFTDPARMALAADGIVEFLIANVENVDAASLRATAATYLDELGALDAEVDDALSVIPEDRRVLVTNHEVFGYFADRYDFEVVGAVIPGGTTGDSVSAQQMVELGEIITAEGVPAIFADTSSNDELSQTIADEVGGIDVVELYSESLGADDSDGATYIEMIRTNAQRIAEALGG